jgi:sporulation protein YlmC with PRC-barrel domain
MSTTTDTGNTGGRLIAAGKVSGTSVYNANGEKLGSVYDVMLDKKSGRSEYAIMSFGGFLGMGEKYHPLPWHELAYEPSKGGFVINLDKAMLEDAPAYDSGDTTTWGDETWDARVTGYYGTSERVEGGLAPSDPALIPPRP